MIEPPAARKRPADRKQAANPADDPIEGGDRLAEDRPARTRISLKLQIDLPGGARIGPGKIRLLELIEQEGSLSRAAEAMHVSYRRAWLFVQHINAAFDEPAVATPEGGHGGAAARLTEFGRELIRHYRQMEASTERECSTGIGWLASHHRT